VAAASLAGLTSPMYGGQEDIGGVVFRMHSSEEVRTRAPYC
jgi:hypothetical protein